MPLWGGDKTWLAPQGRWIDAMPFLDLDSGAFELEVMESGPAALMVEMKSRVCRESGIQIVRTVTLSADGVGWSVRHRLCNRSKAEAEWGIWDVSMVLRPGRVYLPRLGSSAHPQGVKTYTEEGESAAARRSVVRDLGNLVVIDCLESRHFKYGVDSDEGWILGVLETGGGLVGYRKSFPSYPQRTYAHGCVCEVFNSADYPYLEMEIHGPLVRLEPGECCELEERQAVFDVQRWPQDEAELRRHVSP